MKMLFFDVETSYMLLAAFGLYGNDYMTPDSIVQDWHMISAAWKWQGKKRVYAVSVIDDKARFEADPEDDFHVINELHKVLSEADVIVGHNGDKFDIKKFNTRAVYHGLPPLPPLITIDTLKVAKKEFKFSSNRLDYIGKFLGVGQKMDTPKGLWMQVLRGKKDAIKTMVKYNKVDVTLLEDVYDKLKPYMKNHPNRNAFKKDHTVPDGCPCCGSHNFMKNGTRKTKTNRYQRYQCQECGSYFKDGKADKTLKVDLRQ